MNKLIGLLVFFIWTNTSLAAVAEKVIIVNPLPKQQRVVYGVELLKNKLQKIGYIVSVVTANGKNNPANQQLILIDGSFKSNLKKKVFPFNLRKI
ncbi:hypothetical protein LWM68_24580 [Niabella sp. W65]|nr:hypothetical protein [Niabella sp. W65]MCH7365671.1 hypothetical protein [Niabella sp. W65]ULT41441.1 hypothetical protein KRR40_43475 [Niabella sp. I65]